MSGDSLGAPTRGGAATGGGGAGAVAGNKRPRGTLERNHKRSRVLLVSDERISQSINPWYSWLSPCRCLGLDVFISKSWREAAIIHHG